MLSGDSSDGPPPWDVSPSNLAWVEELYYAYLRDPQSVDEAWRREFERMDGGAPVALPPALPAPPAAPNGNGHHAEGNGNAHPVVARPVPVPVETKGHRLPGPQAAEIAAVAAQRALGGKRVRRLIEDYRELGHLAADLDPLG